MPMQTNTKHAMDRDAGRNDWDLSRSARREWRHTRSYRTYITAQKARIRRESRRLAKASLRTTEPESSVLLPIYESSDWLIDTICQDASNAYEWGMWGIPAMRLYAAIQRRDACPIIPARRVG